MKLQTSSLQQGQNARIWEATIINHLNKGKINNNNITLVAKHFSS